MNTRSRAALTLSAAVAIALVLLGSLNGLTREKILQAQQDQLLQSISAVLPPGPFDNNPVESGQQHIASELGSTEPLSIYTAYQHGKPSAVVLELVTMEGYSGQIRLLLGLNHDGSVVAVRTLSHKETPGLGDGIEHRKSSWIDQFDGVSRQPENTAQWRLKKSGGQFDGLSGATITSQAVVRAIQQAVDWYYNNRQRVFRSAGGS